MKVIFSRDNLAERQKVTAIKLYRNLTGADLRSSKLVFDNVDTHGRYTDNLFNISRKEVNEFAENLRGTGYRARATRTVEEIEEYQVYTEQLRILASQAILAGHNDIAQDFMCILEAYSQDNN